MSYQYYNPNGLKMKKLICLLPGVLVLVALSACNDNKHPNNYNYNTDTVIDESGSTFIKQGLEAGLTEIRVAKIAETNSKNPRIISFAKMMVADYTLAGDELEKIGIKNRVSGGDSVSASHQQIIAGLSSKLGIIFDAPYMQMMVSDHENAVRLFTQATQNKNSAIQNFAKKVLPTLKMHLDSAKAIAASLK